MKPRILVVDDEVAMCELVEVGLSKSFEVIWRTSPLEALEVAKHEPIEAVVTDVRMKGMSGTELCRALGETRPDVPVIVMTAFGSMESAIEAMHVGAYD
ncbi:MAG TPA: response regulator, partial [Polyangiaceae bacterium]|nr:response regulator [Polyangiaceae bacterium]